MTSGAAAAAPPAPAGAGPAAATAAPGPGAGGAGELGSTTPGGGPGPGAASPASAEGGWAGLPPHVLERVARKLAEGAERDAAFLKAPAWRRFLRRVEAGGHPYRGRARDGLLAFALACRSWRAAALAGDGGGEGGGKPLRTRVGGLLGSPGLAQLWWALGIGAPREARYTFEYKHFFDRPELSLGAGWKAIEIEWEQSGKVAFSCVAAARGDIGALRQLLDQGIDDLHADLAPPLFVCVSSAAARSGHFNVLSFLHNERGIKWEQMEMACNAVAGTGDLDLLRRLVDLGCPVDAKVTEEAVAGGELKVLAWLQQRELLRFGAAKWEEEGAPEHDPPEPDMGADDWDSDLWEVAVAYGELETLQWLHAQRCYLPPGLAAERAAAHGHREVLEWLRAEGFPWDGETCYQAVDKGHVEVLRWARANGCEWDAATRDRAAAELGYTDDLGNLVASKFAF